MTRERTTVVLFYPRDDTLPAWTPHCYLRLAPALREAGFDPVVIDQRVQDDWRERLESRIDDALWIGFSLITGVMIRYALEVSAIVKARRPDLPVVWGGWHPSCVPEQTLAHPLIDYVVCGPAEEIVADLCLHLQGRAPIPPRVFDKKRIAASKSPLANMKPVRPDAQRRWRTGYSLIPDMDHYRSRNNVAALFGSVSCAYGKCTFCSIVSMYKYTRRDTSELLDEIQFLVEENGFDTLVFQDGLFFTAPKISMPIVQGILDRGIKMQWKAKARADGFNRFSDEQMRLIRASGFVEVHIGFESASQRMLDKMAKGTKVEHAHDAARICAKWDISLIATYLCALPGETVNELCATIEQMHAVNRTGAKFAASLGYYLPVPGAATYDEFVATGGKVPASLDEWKDANWENPDLNPLHWLSPADRTDFLRLYYSNKSVSNWKAA